MKGKLSGRIYEQSLKERSGWRQEGCCCFENRDPGDPEKGRRKLKTAQALLPLSCQLPTLYFLSIPPPPLYTTRCHLHLSVIAVA